MGLSSCTVNVLWAVSNLLAACLLLRRTGNFELRQTKHAVPFGLGVFVMAIVQARAGAWPGWCRWLRQLPAAVALPAGLAPTGRAGLEIMPRTVPGTFCPPALQIQPQSRTKKEKNAQNTAQTGNTTIASIPERIR
jgi:hypothetical protein